MSEHVISEPSTIWRSPILNGSKHVQTLYARRSDGSYAASALVRARKTFRDIPLGEEPAFISVDAEGEPPGARVADAMTIVGGFIVVSQKLRDVLVQFNLGATRLIELPIYQDEHRTPSDLPPHYMLHVCEAKDGFSPEASKGATRMYNPITREPLPNGPWLFRSRSEGDAIALSASDVDGVDLWGYGNLRGHIFFSDPLKQAIDKAQIKTKALTFHECVTLD